MNEQMPSHKPEIMSPAGYWPQLHAAIEAGADAVYFGLTHFTARAKVGFTLTELPEVMRTLHQRGVKGYVTFNTLVFDHELDEAVRALADIAAAGADSIIVQDVAVARLAAQIAPELAIHGSTQMSITSAEGVLLAQQWGVSRVVLARELALAEVRQIRQQLLAAQSGVELEMFVHGALCVSYSGQCFSSEAWGGRSANRGQCAQACRLPYQMIVDGVLRPLADSRYLLSPGDLYALHQMPEIVQLGVAALKIEGRYKDANYVALTTQAYRQAVDAAWAQRPLPITPATEQQLIQVYSRGLGPHFLQGTNHQAVVNGRAPRHRGLLMGRVVRMGQGSVTIQPEAGAALKPGDGVVFDAADWRSPEEPEEGSRVYHVHPQANGQVTVEFGNGTLNWSRIRVGDWVWRTHDPDVEKAAKLWTQASQPVRQQPVRVTGTAQPGQPLQLVWSLVERPLVQVTVQSAEPLAEARQQPVTADFVQAQLGRLGNTPYFLAELRIEMDGNPFIPSSLLNQLRREAVAGLQAQQGAAPARTIHNPGQVLQTALAEEAESAGEGQMEPQMHLLVRNKAQLTAAIALKPDSITLDYLDLYGLRSDVEQVQAAGVAVRVAAPRALKPDEQRIVNFLRRLDCPLLVRSAGLLYELAQGAHAPLTGDFSLNAANEVTARTFLQMGLARLTPTHDLNGAQITELARRVGAHHLEVLAYQHLPVFYTEHCVFCRFLSSGTSYQDCGTPCERHEVGLRDAYGRIHPVLADVGCRNTVFGAEAQTAVAHLDAWRAVGIRHFRLEFVHESAAEVTAVGQAFQAWLAGQSNNGVLAAAWRSAAPQGMTEGSLFVPDDYLTLPVLQ